MPFATLPTHNAHPPHHRQWVNSPQLWTTCHTEGRAENLYMDICHLPLAIHNMVIVRVLRVSNWIAVRSRCHQLLYGHCLLDCAFCHYGLVATPMPLDIKLHPLPTQVENSLAYQIPPSLCDYHLYSFSPTLWLEHSSWSGHKGLFPWGIQGYDSWITQVVFWYSIDNRCRELRPYHEEPLFSFSFSFFCCFSCLVLLHLVLLRLS